MSSWTPSIVPRGADQTVYLVLNDFGLRGRAFLETDEEKADLETIMTNMLSGEYSSPIKVIGFNVAEGWARDVSEDVAEELQRIAHTVVCSGWGSEGWHGPFGVR